MTYKISKEQLIELYINQKLSSRDCAKQLGISQRTVLNRLIQFCIPTRPTGDNGQKSKYIVHTPEWNRKVSEALKKHNAMKGKFWNHHHGYKDGARSYQCYLERGFLPSVCSECHDTSETRKLIVHHIDGNRHNNNLDNLIVLCHSCHRKLHIRRQNGKKA